MKVLFAVNNDKISEAVIKKYPKDYRELLSYKNVYYFNAILKEIQNDKSYDRIVISEDLEPFVNTNHDSIDNFIFNQLDKISDEAQGNDGKEIAIILICSERRTFGSGILNKLFSIGIYNALIGNDRSMDNLCRLINKPRTKKEAKAYYRIDQGIYDSPSEVGEVSETEIQNILNYFKKLGKNTDRYTDSFNNIAAQYTDEQLKLIINVLPMKVKAVLEAESDKYQSLMGSSGEVNRKVIEEEPGISVNTIGKGREAGVNGPIVIPSGIKTYTSSKPIIPNNINNNQRVSNQIRQSSSQEQVINNSINRQVIQPTERIVPKNVQQKSQVQPQPSIIKTPQQVQNTENNIIPTSISPKIENPVQIQQKEDVKLHNGQRYTGTIEQVKRTLIARRKVNPIQQVEKSITPTQISKLPVEEDDIDQKRGRGRPKKENIDVVEKPKGKRGRPKKNSLDESEENNEINNLLGGIGNNGVIKPETENTYNNVVLPGLDDNSDLNNDEMLPGLDSNTDNDEMLPGLNDNADSSNDGVIPGVANDTDSDDGEGEEVDVDSLFKKLDDDSDTSAENSNDDEILPGLDDNTDSDGGMLPGLDDENSSDDETLPGLDENDDSNEEETILPGMGFDNDNDTTSTQNNNNSIESIKSPINYSTSNLNSLLSKDKKIVAFVGATKNGTSFLINNLALMFSMMGINTAILDMTQNRNSYYLFTDSREELRKIAYTSLSKLENGYADGIKFNKNLTVYTALPSDGNIYENAEPILSTLIQNHSLVLIDTDFNTPPAYFASSQEIYLVQSMDILTIQPLTAFLRDLKFKGAWEPEKARVVINKEVPIRILSKNTIVGGMSRYNGPDMSVMTDLFNKDMVNVCSIPFDEKVYAKYLETLATCKLSISSLPKQFRSKLELLANMVYPRLNSKASYSPSQDIGGANYSTPENTFSNNTNNILNKMKKKF